MERLSEIDSEIDSLKLTLVDDSGWLPKGAMREVSNACLRDPSRIRVSHAWNVSVETGK